MLEMEEESSSGEEVEWELGMGVEHVLPACLPALCASTATTTCKGDRPSSARVHLYLLASCATIKLRDTSQLYE